MEEQLEQMSDLVSQIEAHEHWLKEQFSKTRGRLNGIEQCMRQSDRLKKMLQTQKDSPSKHQMELIDAMKRDFLKALENITTDMVQDNNSINNEGIQVLKNENEVLKNENLSIKEENERLQRLKDLLMQQQDSMNNRLNEYKSKEVEYNNKINELNDNIQKQEKNSNKFTENLNNFEDDLKKKDKEIEDRMKEIELIKNENENIQNRMKQILIEREKEIQQQKKYEVERDKEKKEIDIKRKEIERKEQEIKHYQQKQKQIEKETKNEKEIEITNNNNNNNNNINQIENCNVLSNDDLLIFLNISKELQPIDLLISNVTKQWLTNNQIFFMDFENQEIKENETNLFENIDNTFNDKWNENHALINNIQTQLSNIKQRTDNNNQNGCALIVNLFEEKLKLLNHLANIHINRSKNMSQIMIEANKKIELLQKDLSKKTREMEIHLKVKEKMYREVKSVQEQVANVFNDYQIISKELDHVRRRNDSIDSTYSN